MICIQALHPPPPLLVAFKHLQLPLASDSQIHKAKKRTILGYLPGTIRKTFSIPKYQIIQEKSAFVYDEALFERQGKYYIGFFQNEKYFKDIAAEIVRDFTFAPITDTYTQKRAERILGVKNSVFVHIRRGDYVRLGWDLSLEYYKKAAQIIADKIENPTFFIFGATDKNYLKDFDIGYPYEDMSEKEITAHNFYEDMRLMSLCKSGIVANSSYSWWGAYLGENQARDTKERVIVAPSPWLLNENDIICQNWLRVHLPPQKVS